MPEATFKQRVKPQLARAWFDTVLNPLIWALRTETELVGRGDFTWRSYSGRLASLVPVRSHLRREALDNLDQFLSFYPELNQAMDRHDEKLQLLHDGVSAYYSALRQLPELHEMLRNLEAGDDMSDYAAEYIVNGLTHLPSQYAAAGFWNTHFAEFIGLRERPKIRPLWESVQAGNSKFEEAAAELLAKLKSVRSELSVDLDVPIVLSIAG